MKISPVSGDLLVKLAMGAAVVGGVYLLTRRAIDGLPTWPSLPDFGGALAGALDTVTDAGQRAASTIGVNYAQDLPPTSNPYGISMTPAEQAIADNYRPFGGALDRLFNTDWAANEARRLYAATDPRRLDL